MCITLSTDEVRALALLLRHVRRNALRQTNKECTTHPTRRLAVTCSHESRSQLRNATFVWTVPGKHVLTCSCQETYSRTVVKETGTHVRLPGNGYSPTVAKETGTHVESADEVMVGPQVVRGRVRFRDGRLGRELEARRDALRIERTHVNHRDAQSKTIFDRSAETNKLLGGGGVSLRGSLAPEGWFPSSKPFIGTAQASRVQNLCFFTWQFSQNCAPTHCTKRTPSGTFQWPA